MRDHLAKRAYLWNSAEGIILGRHTVRRFQQTVLHQRVTLPGIGADGIVLRAKRLPANHPENDGIVKSMKR